MIFRTNIEKIIESQNYFKIIADLSDIAVEQHPLLF